MAVSNAQILQGPPSLTRRAEWAMLVKITGASMNLTPKASLLAATALVLLADTATPSMSAILSSTAPVGFELQKGRAQAPRTPFVDQAGKRVTLDTFKGKVVVLNFWATYCGPCIVEMPSLERLSQRLPTDRFVVLPVSQDKGGAPIATPFLAKIGVHKLKVFFDTNARLYRDFSVRGLPTTFVVNRDGTVASRLEGTYQWDTPEISAYLEAISKQGVAGK